MNFLELINKITEEEVLSEIYHAGAISLIIYENTDISNQIHLIISM